MNKRRLKKLADFLDTLENGKFSIGHYVYPMGPVSCGTTACAMGWLPVVFPRLCISNSIGIPRLRSKPELWVTEVMNELFGISESDVDCIFHQIGYKKKRVTAKMVAAKIRLFVNQ